MADMPSHVDSVFLKRWADSVSFREAMADFEDRLGAGLETAAESLRPWLDERGYGFLEVESKYARINVARSGWVNQQSKQPWVWFMLDALLPHGYRRVQEERPLVWVVTRNLEKDDRSTFQRHLANRLRGKEGDGRTKTATGTTLWGGTFQPAAMASDWHLHNRQSHWPHSHGRRSRRF